MTDVQELARKLLDWNQRKVAQLRLVAAQAKAGTIFVLGNDKKEVEATSREALFFQLGVEAALSQIGTLPIKLEQKKPTRKRSA